jgi:hypothetical protein
MRRGLGNGMFKMIQIVITQFVIVRKAVMRIKKKLL